MAWVRLVRTDSWATAVQIAVSVAGQRRIVAHWGSTNSEMQLGVLIEQVPVMLAETDQTKLNLGLTLTARQAERMKPVADATLLGITASDDPEQGYIC